MEGSNNREFKLGNMVMEIAKPNVHVGVIIYMDELSVGIRRLEEPNETAEIHWTVYSKLIKLTPKQVLNRLNLGSKKINDIWMEKHNGEEFNLPIDGTPLQYAKYLLEVPNTRFKGILKFTAYDDLVKGSISILTEYQKTEISANKKFHITVAQSKVIYEFKRKFTNPIYFYGT